MSSRKEAILAAALPVLPILVRYLQLAIEELAMHTFLTPYRYHWGCTLCLFHCKFDSKLTGKYISSFYFHSVFLYGGWLPAYSFVHLILFLVGLWACQDKTSVIAAIAVSLGMSLPGS